MHMFQNSLHLKKYQIVLFLQNYNKVYNQFNNMLIIIVYLSKSGLRTLIIVWLDTVWLTYVCGPLGLWC